jgi:hypothetical protein
MRGIKSFGIGLKCAETGFGAEENRPPAIFGVRKILRIGVVKDSSAKSHEVRRANLDEFGSIHDALIVHPLKINLYCIYSDASRPRVFTQP